jgi:hypothetical protein
VQANSEVHCTNCTFHKNFAMIGGVALAESDGIIHFENSIIYENYALAAPVLILQDNNHQSVFKNVTVKHNKDFSFDELVTELFLKCTILCFLNSNF